MVGRCVSNKAQAPYEPNLGPAPHRSAGPDDREALPSRDQTRKRIGPAHSLAAPSWIAPAIRRLIPTESRFIPSLNKSFATHSGIERTTFARSELYRVCPVAAIGR